MQFDTVVDLADWLEHDSFNGFGMNEEDIQQLLEEKQFNFASGLKMTVSVSGIIK